MRARSERVLNGPPARSYSETDSSNGPDPWMTVLVGYRTLLFGLRRSAGNSSSNYGEVLTVRLAWWRSPSLMGARGDIAPLMTRLCELLRWYGTLATITSRHLEVDAKALPAERCGRTKREPPVVTVRRCGSLVRASAHAAGPRGCDVVGLMGI
jgi:hypothetical protein